MTSFLERLDPTSRERLLDVAEVRTLDAGASLVRQGELGGDLFVVKEGALEARDGTQPLARLGPGHLVGEVAFLDGGPRSAAVVALERAVVLAWPREALEALLARDTALRAAVLEAIALTQARSMRRLTAAPPSAPPDRTVELAVGRFDESDRSIVRADGSRVVLSPIEARLLAYLVARPGRTLSHRLLLDEVWGYSSKVQTRTVYATVHRLRVKIELDPGAPRHIVAIAGGGYRFDP